MSTDKRPRVRLVGLGWRKKPRRGRKGLLHGPIVVPGIDLSDDLTDLVRTPTLLPARRRRASMSGPKPRPQIRLEAEAVDQEAAIAELSKILLEFAGVAEGLPPDLAAQHDHYLHGLPKR